MPNAKRHKSLTHTYACLCKQRVSTFESLFFAFGGSSCVYGHLTLHSPWPNPVLPTSESPVLGSLPRP